MPAWLPFGVRFVFAAFFHYFFFLAETLVQRSLGGARRDATARSRRGGGEGAEANRKRERVHDDDGDAFAFSLIAKPS